MNTQPVILLNIAETIPVLDGLVLYALADGNENSRKVDNFECCMKFQLHATNTNTGERTKQKYALHGRLISRKGVGVDHQFVLEKITEKLKEHLAKSDRIISGDAEPGVFMTRAIWRYIFAAGARVSNFANGIGIFSQPAETNFNIGEDPIEKLHQAAGTFTLAIANEKLVKFYLGEEFPVWGAVSNDPEDKMWTPCKKKLASVNINECLEHFTTFISTENETLHVFPSDKMEDLVAFVQSRINGEAITEQQPQAQEEAPKESKKAGGLLRRLLPLGFTEVLSAKGN